MVQRVLGVQYMPWTSNEVSWEFARIKDKNKTTILAEKQHHPLFKYYGRTRFKNRSVDRCCWSMPKNVGGLGTQRASRRRLVKQVVFGIKQAACLA